MSWDQEEFLRRLVARVDRFDRQGTAALCGELIGHVEQGVRLAHGIGRKVLATLRRKAHFDLIEQVAESLHVTEQDDAQIRRQYAQALIEQGQMTAALYVLEGLIERTSADPEENAEARGLLGRVYKQLYVDAVSADPGATAQPRTRLHLQRSMKAYADVYRNAAATHLWHGINAVAISARAARDDVALQGAFDGSTVAHAILDVLAARQGALPPFDLATAAEASLALGDTHAALLRIAEYVQREDADAFEIASTLRQLQQVWGLTIDTPPGSLLLPLLQAALLQRRGGRVDLDVGDVARTARRTGEAETRVGGNPQLERILGKEGVVSLQWYRLGLERAGTVAKVVDRAGDGFGTGFLVRGGDLAPRYGDEILLLTNAHVVSTDPSVQTKHKALDPDDAAITFEASDALAGRQFRVRNLLWTSPPEDLDASLLRLDPAIPASALAPIARRLPVLDEQSPQKVYVIGHPGGRTLSISLNDNLLLDWDDRLVHYRAPTEGGSSGSPVFNQQWSLIGLHHAGGDEVRKLNGKSGTYAANEGIWIGRIIIALGSTP